MGRFVWSFVWIFVKLYTKIKEEQTRDEMWGKWSDMADMLMISILGEKTHGKFEAAKNNRMRTWIYIYDMIITYPIKVAALEGAALSKQGPIPRKKPAAPSVAKVLRTQSRADAYFLAEPEKPSVWSLDLTASMG